MSHHVNNRVSAIGGMIWGWLGTLAWYEKAPRWFLYIAAALAAINLFLLALHLGLDAAERRLEREAS